MIRNLLYTEILQKTIASETAATESAAIRGEQPCSQYLYTKK